MPVLARQPVMQPEPWILAEAGGAVSGHPTVVAILALRRSSVIASRFIALAPRPRLKSSPQPINRGPLSNAFAHVFYYNRDSGTDKGFGRLSNVKGFRVAHLRRDSQDSSRCEFSRPEQYRSRLLKEEGSHDQIMAALDGRSSPDYWPVGRIPGGTPTAHAIPAAPAPLPTITVNPPKPIKAEVFQVTGALPTAAVCPVTLQAKSGSKWKSLGTANTDAGGAFSLAASTRTAKLTLRVLGTETSDGGRWSALAA